MKILARILTAFIPFGRIRSRARQRLVFWLYSYPVKRKAKRVGKGFHTDGHTVVSKTTSIGDGVSGHGFLIHGGGEVSIGNYVQMGMGTFILSQNHNYEGDLLPFDDKWIYKDVVIGDAVWIGANVTILPGTHIGEGAIIQAGSVVHGEIPPCAIAGGNPAKVFAWRNKEHYQALKAQNRYLGQN